MLIKKICIAIIIAFILLLPINVLAKRGCCSWHGGVSQCDTNSGRYICNDGSYSPSCKCEINKIQYNNQRKLNLTLNLLTPGKSPSDIPYHVCFTPGGKCTDLIVNTINQATKQILVQAYSFTSKPIAEALVSAQKRGVDVKIILDKSQESEKYSELDYVYQNGIPVWIDYKPAIAHNKIMIFDSCTTDW